MRHIKDVLDYSKAVELYQDKHISCENIGLLFGYSKSAVNNLLRKYKITIRERGEKRINCTNTKICRKCNKEKGVSLFYESSAVCKNCISLINKAHRLSRIQAEIDAEMIRKKTFWANNAPRLNAKRKERHLLHRDEENQKSKEYHQRNKNITKREVLTYYGNGDCACVICGESRLACLSIDHINGNGTSHRKEIKHRRIYDVLKKDYPAGYQTLCMNCQFVKREEKKEYSK